MIGYLWFGRRSMHCGVDPRRRCRSRGGIIYTHGTLLLTPWGTIRGRRKWSNWMVLDNTGSRAANLP